MYLTTSGPPRQERRQTLSHETNEVERFWPSRRFRNKLPAQGQFWNDANLVQVEVCHNDDYDDEDAAYAAAARLAAVDGLLALMKRTTQVRRLHAQLAREKTIEQNNLVLHAVAGPPRQPAQP